MNIPLFDVIAVNIKTGEQRVLASGKTERNADAIVNMAVMRRGVDDEFYKTVPHEPASRAIRPQSLARERYESAWREKRG